MGWPEACASSAATISLCRASASGSASASSECGAAARYSGPPTKKAILCGGVAPRMSVQNLSRLSFSPATIDEHQIVQIGAPPAARLKDIGRAIHFDAKFSHHVGAQDRVSSAKCPAEVRASSSRNAIQTQSGKASTGVVMRFSLWTAAFAPARPGASQPGPSTFFRLLWRRLIFCLRRRLNLALSPLTPDIFSPAFAGLT